MGLYNDLTDIRHGMFHLILTTRLGRQELTLRPLKHIPIFAVIVEKRFSSSIIFIMFVLNNISVTVICFKVRGGKKRTLSAISTPKDMNGISEGG